MGKALTYYSLKKEELQRNIDKLNKNGSFYSLLRLMIFIGAIAVMYIAYKNNNTSFMYLTALIFGGLFLGVAYRHGRVLEELKHSKARLKVMEKGLARLQENFQDFQDRGEEYIDKDHPYSFDLDIFGEGSLFQRINGSSTYLGRERLASELNGTYKFTKEEIEERQEAIEELADKADFRGELEAIGIMEEGKKSSPEELLKWKDGREGLFSSGGFMSLVYGLNILTLIVVILLVFNIVDYRILLLDLLINGAFLLTGKRKRAEALKLIELYKENINSYFKVVELIEKEAFESRLLINLQNSLKEGEKSAAYQLKELAKIVNRLKDTHNAYYHLVNLAALMDYHVLHSLEKWRGSYGKSIERWLDAAGKIEALGSLGVINFENEDYALPKLHEENILEGLGIGHPLLGKTAVVNDFSLKKPKSMVLITGSNMSGKSTFLRTLGLNLVLSYLGTRVRAESFTCGIMDIYTCMRINDNLKESISSFYAELLRIKKIIEASSEGRPIFYLLDEIFKGTNSKDRHKGAEILLKQLMHRNTLGLVSTHDLELTDMEKTSPKVLNYHFREYYEDNKLKFDYKLRRGYSTTQNALYLMRMIGIEEQE